ncbi:MAG: hypothetical protein PVI21_04995 [Candidatus Woesebacteria bacterium]|jgi:hypothetical protein
MGWFKKNTNKKESGRQPKKMSVDQAGYVFRRSRTLTGSTSAKVKPTAASRSQLKTPRLKAHELYQERKKILRVLGLLALGMMFMAFLIVNYIADCKINYIALTDATPNISEYQSSLKEYFGERPIERFGFLLDTDQINYYMQQKHGEIENFEAYRQWYGGDVEFEVEFRQPILVWQVDSQKFYVDDQGVAFTYDNFKQPLVSVEDKSGISPDSGSSVASRRFIRFLGQLVGAVNTNDQGKVKAVIIPTSTREIDLTLEGREYPIKTHIDRDPLQQAEDISNALKYFDSKNITPQYVDVRVLNKAFYK